MDLFDPQSRKAVLAAERAASSLGHQMGTPHLLIGLLAIDSHPAARVLAGFGVTSRVVLAHMANTGSTPATTRSRMDDELVTVLNAVQRQARADGAVATTTDLARAVLTAGHAQVDAVLHQAATSAATVLAALDAVAPTVADVDARFDQEGLAPASSSGGSLPGKGLPADLAKYGYDLVASARNGELSPVHGRARELDRIQVILGRRTKSNPVLIGDAGVGKTAVVEGLAQAIAGGRCAETLRDRPLVVLDVAAMIAGARTRGDFEERLKKAVAAAQSINAIVFIDEIHQIVGAGASGGAMDAANLLKENLARGQFTLLGATTVEEYRKHIESDAALERRLEPVRIDAPSVEQTVDILRAVKNTFAAHHKVTYTDEAVHAAAHLTHKHVRDRQLPDKAIDALDEAGAAASIAVMRSGENALKLYTARATGRTALGKAIAEERYEDAGPLAAKDKALTSQILQETGTDLSVVDEAAVARIVAATAGVPVGSIATGEHDALKTLGETLSRRVVGQEHAVHTVTSLVRRRRVLGAERPTSLLFAGPTGVGKTELAKALADVLFSGGDTGLASVASGAFVRFDMSEFTEKHTVARLIGAPPGYVGHEEGGELTEAVRRNPNSVILLDEVEKAHPDVFDVLLQVFEDGHLTDGSGKVVSFKDSIVILTSNLGSSRGSGTPIGFATMDTSDKDAAARVRVAAAVKAHFRPEFINRLDNIVVFDPLSKHDLTGILANMLDRPLAQLADKGVTVRLSDAALDLLLDAGYDRAMGARPLRRAITRLLENALSDALLAGELPAGTSAYVDVSSDRTGLVVLPEPSVEALISVNEQAASI